MVIGDAIFSRSALFISAVTAWMSLEFSIASVWVWALRSETSFVKASSAFRYGLHSWRC